MNMADVTMTMEEYLQLINGLSGNSMMMNESREPGQAPEPAKKRSRKARASDKKLSAAFKEANAKLRTKNGKLRKGKTQADVARMAHKLRKKM